MEQTFGQKAVGLSFNPSGDDAVGFCKQRFAEVIEQMNEYYKNNESAMQTTFIRLAMDQCILAQMACVKAITWKD